MTFETNEASYKLEIPPVESLPSVAYEDRRTLPLTGGVYFVTGALGAILYVGSTKNLRTRWSGHHRHSQLSEAHGVRIAWLEVKETAFRLALEHHCVEVLHPLYQQVAMPLRRNKRGEHICDVTLHLPQSVFDRLAMAAQDYTRTLPNQILHILDRLISSGQLDKWACDSDGRQKRGSSKLRRIIPTRQLPLLKH